MAKYQWKEFTVLIAQVKGNYSNIVSLSFFDIVVSFLMKILHVQYVLGKDA